MPLTLLLLLAFALIAVWRGQRNLFLTEYLFFVRIPLALGALVSLLPLYGPALAEDLMGNVFVLDRIGTAVVTFAALLALWSITYAGRLIWISVPARCMLFLSREEQRRHREDDSLLRATEELEPAPLSAALYVAVGVVLTIPLLLRLLRSSPSGEVVFGYALGLACATGLLFAARALRSEGVTRFVLLPGARGMPPGIRRYHHGAAWFFLFTAVVYGVFFVVGNPHLYPWTAEHMPALTYVYLLAMLAGWILSAASFQLDRSRAPLFSVLVVASVLAQSILPGRHLYKVVEAPEEAAAPGENLALESLERSWEARNAPSRVCGIACSGGGIVASYWTAFVLEQLEHELASAEGGFGEQVLLMSSVSGGGIGAMLYVDRFRPGRTPREEMSEVRRAAGTTSLAAAVWGLTYPDLMRLAVPFFPTYDRGWAIERSWGRRMGDPMTTLGDWRAGVEAGWRPLLVLNATHQETGERLLLAPASMGASVERMRTSLAPGRDLLVTTAARLSATFPLVLPQARPERDDAVLGQGFHVADGGYYDNSGVVTLLETVQDFVERTRSSPHGSLERVAIIEIRASPAYADVLDDAGPGGPGPFERVTPARGGLFNHLFGPLATLFNVRTTSQAARNRFESRLFQECADLRPTRLRTFVFQLGPDQPLSWHLTDEERDLIECHWPATRRDVYEAALAEASAGDREAQERLHWLRACRERNAEALGELRTFLQE